MYPAIDFSKAIVKKLVAGDETHFRYEPGDSTSYVVSIAPAHGAELLGYAPDHSRWRVTLHNMGSRGSVQEAYVSAGDVQWVLGQVFDNPTTRRAIQALVMRHLWPDMPNPAADAWVRP